MQATLDRDFTAETAPLAVSLELSKGSWKLALHDGKREKPAIHTVSEAGAQERLSAFVKAIKDTQAKWKMPSNTRIIVRYEAGQDGFWISRALAKLGIDVLIVDPASIPVERHARRAKTDRLDAIKLVTCLRAWLRGERERMHILHEPAQEAEAQRHLVRDRGELQKEIGQHRDRIRKLLRTVGCWDDVASDFRERLDAGNIRCYDQSALPPELSQRLQRECQRLALAEQQLKQLEKSLVKALPENTQQRINSLSQLKAVGTVGATRLVTELFWRDFHNRRQVGACLGLTPQPYDSGESRIDQGISKQGNRRVRALMIEMAWMWLRYQPESALSRWFAERTQSNAPNKRGRRIAIIAVARRLAIALWRYLKEGIVPLGAQMKGS
jgi:transposase